MLIAMFVFKVQFLCEVAGYGAVRRSEASSEHENEEVDSDHGDSFTRVQHDNETLQELQEHIDQQGDVKLLQIDTNLFGTLMF